MSPISVPITIRIGLVNLWIQDIRDTRDKNIEVGVGAVPGRAKLPCGWGQGSGAGCTTPAHTAPNTYPVDTTAAPILPPYTQTLRKLQGPEQVDKLVELNVMRQVSTRCFYGCRGCLFV